MQLVAELERACARVYIFANSALDADLRAGFEAPGRRIAIIDSPGNVGVGLALNRLVERAEADQFSQIVLFDQDSRLVQDVIATLVVTWRALSAAGAKPAAVGPRMAAPRNEGNRYRVPRIFRKTMACSIANALSVWFLPTSGTLIDIAAFKAVGGFRSDYFIDGIDLEWCFRAWSAGYSCWLSTGSLILHKVGAGTVKLSPFGGQTPDQPDFRMATYVRNTIYGFHLRHIPVLWKLKQALYLPLQIAATWSARRFNPGYLRCLTCAALSGWRGSLGGPDSLPGIGDWQGGLPERRAPEHREGGL